MKAQDAADDAGSPSRSRLNTFGQIAASLSDFYGWILRQAGHKVALPHTDKSRAAIVTTHQKPVAAVPAAGLQLDTACKAKKKTNAKQYPSVFKRINTKQLYGPVVLPKIYTMHGISAHNMLLDDLCYRTSDGTVVQSIRQPMSTPLEENYVYTDWDPPTQRPHTSQISSRGAMEHGTLSPIQPLPSSVMLVAQEQHEACPPTVSTTSFVIETVATSTEAPKQQQQQLQSMGSTLTHHTQKPGHKSSPRSAGSIRSSWSDNTCFSDCSHANSLGHSWPAVQLPAALDQLDAVPPQTKTFAQLKEVGSACSSYGSLQSSASRPVEQRTMLPSFALDHRGHEASSMHCSSNDQGVGADTGCSLAAETHSIAATSRPQQSAGKKRRTRKQHGDASAKVVNAGGKGKQQHRPKRRQLSDVTNQLGTVHDSQARGQMTPLYCADVTATEEVYI